MNQPSIRPRLIYSLGIQYLQIPIAVHRPETASAKILCPLPSA